VGAFVGEELVAALGLHGERGPSADGTTLARYQEVTTDARWRRRGLCSALMSRAAEALAPLAIDRYLILADAHDIARRVYAARGFTVAGPWRGLSRPGPARSAQASVETASAQ
jgi:GNAT superfamily N-acetyltransferase